jgi:hypothetical protein
VAGSSGVLAGWWACGGLAGQWASGWVAVWQACRVGAQWMAAAWGPTCSFSVLWGGGAFHGSGVQGAEVSTLPGALPQPSVSPVSQQGP